MIINSKDPTQEALYNEVLKQNTVTNKETTNRSNSKKYTLK